MDRVIPKDHDNNITIRLSASFMINRKQLKYENYSRKRKASMHTYIDNLVAQPASIFRTKLRNVVLNVEMVFNFCALLLKIYFFEVAAFFCYLAFIQSTKFYQW